MKPRIFVGTLYVCEGDYLECSRIIKAQKDVHVTHHIVVGMQEKAAHNALWDAWNSAKFDHDLFIKVDADTVVRDETTFSKIWSLFDAEPRLTGIQAPLHDYMTDDLIFGLNVSSPKVIYAPSLNGLYCDRGVDSGHDVVFRTDKLPPELVPAGYHCHYSTEMQAFHYGVHRSLKNQHDTMAKVRKAWKKSKDRVRGFALFGEAMASQFSNENHNYEDLFFQHSFDVAKKSYDEWCKTQ